ncbi:hypothetical protein G7Y89_g11851 [Cudoniella acicularis]|uniref:Uncharacterized protein n=1 Tax=Cudoniella acicularis TaxID=354080 RepID=A0A8H4VZS7_9HELO|nr:hypothetical protein G7Y89_g11851 [Cudoniella acicularis]
MFEHFTFGAHAHAQSHEDDAAPSPTDTSFPSPISPQSFPFQWEEASQTGINDIVHKLSNSSLTHHESAQQSPWQSQLPSPYFDHDPFTEEEMSFVSTTRGMARVRCGHSSLPIPSRKETVASRRMQRQLNVQLQTCSSHVRDINALVEDMIVSNSQCNLQKSTKSYPLSPPSDELVIDPMEFTGNKSNIYEDEGFSEMEDPVLLMKEEISLRRASTPSGIRKHNGIRYRASAECVGNPTTVNSRMKVRSVPRMRRREVLAVRK